MTKQPNRKDWIWASYNTQGDEPEKANSCWHPLPVPAREVRTPVPRLRHRIFRRLHGDTGDSGAPGRRCGLLFPGRQEPAGRKRFVGFGE